MDRRSQFAMEDVGDIRLEVPRIEIVVKYDHIR